MLAFLLWLVSLMRGPSAALPLDVPPPPPGAGSNDCESSACGNSNGTRMTGLAVGITDEVRTITLPSGEIFTLR